MKKSVFIAIFLILLIIPVVFAFKLGNTEVFSLNKMFSDFFAKITGRATTCPSLIPPYCPNGVLVAQPGTDNLGCPLPSKCVTNCAIIKSGGGYSYDYTIPNDPHFCFESCVNDKMKLLQITNVDMASNKLTIKVTDTGEIYKDISFILNQPTKLNDINPIIILTMDQNGITLDQTADCTLGPITELTNEWNTCIFKGSEVTQTCYSNGIYQGQCSGIGSCVIHEGGLVKESITWKSTCGGYGYTIIDGVDEKIEFDCSNTQTTPVITPGKGDKCIVDINRLTYSIGQGSSVGGVTVVDVDEAETKCIIEYAGKTYIIDKGQTQTMTDGTLIGITDVYAYHGETITSTQQGCSSNSECEKQYGTDYYCRNMGGTGPNVCLEAKECQSPSSLSTEQINCLINIFRTLGEKAFVCDADYFSRLPEYVKCTESQTVYITLHCMLKQFPEISSQLTSCVGEIKPIDPSLPITPEEVEIISVEGKCTNGCLFNGNCIPYGTRVKGSYCDLYSNIVSQKSADEGCENNYECDANLCISSKCISAGLWDKIVQWFAKLFSI